MNPALGIRQGILFSATTTPWLIDCLLVTFIADIQAFQERRHFRNDSTQRTAKAGPRAHHTCYGNIWGTNGISKKVWPASIRSACLGSAIRHVSLCTVRQAQPGRLSACLGSSPLYSLIGVLGPAHAKQCRRLQLQHHHPQPSRIPDVKSLHRRSSSWKDGPVHLVLDGGVCGNKVMPAIRPIWDEKGKRRITERAWVMMARVVKAFLNGDRVCPAAPQDSSRTEVSKHRMTIAGHALT
jgi:hypothetical protein